MNDSRALRLVTSCVLLIGMLPWATGCRTNMQPDGEEAPEIPPASTFVMDFSDFVDGGASKLALDRTDPTTMQLIVRANWGRAALKVGIWNAIITVGLAVPVAAFLESFNHIPEIQTDGSWVWSYEVSVTGVIHTAELHALVVDGNVEWNMFISKEGFYTDFNWFSGLSNLAGTEGTWTLNKDPDDPTAFVGIEWHRNLQDETGDIKYTNIVPDGPENGGYIFHGITGEAFDAFYEIFNKGQDNLTNIEWSRTTKEGRIRDPAHFSDEDWRCWDTALLDIECP
ncbi:MAG: hypothetical protein JSU86_02250 [Phycisphaerales bacterium]|nr:MAG: hypothetical protein JSU86_02250 [Phycisphaerales bacterium]